MYCVALAPPGTGCLEGVGAGQEGGEQTEAVRDAARGAPEICADCQVLSGL